MVNFISQLGWAKRWPASWKSIISGYLENIFGRLAFDLLDWVKRPAFTNMDGHHPIDWMSKRGKGQKGKLSLFLGWKVHIFPTLRYWMELLVLGPYLGLWDLHQWSPSSKAFGLGLGYIPFYQLPWFSGLWTQTEVYH